MTVIPSAFAPAPSVLKKLDAALPGCTVNLEQQAAILTCRRHDESLKLSTIFLRACQKKWDDFKISLILYGGPHNPAIGVSMQVYEKAVAEQEERERSRIWCQRGDDLRLAIADLMAKNNLTADALDLTAEERASLTLRLPKEAPGTPRPARPVIWNVP